MKIGAEVRWGWGQPFESIRRRPPAATFIRPVPFLQVPSVLINAYFIDKLYLKGPFADILHIVRVFGLCDLLTAARLRVPSRGAFGKNNRYLLIIFSSSNFAPPPSCSAPVAVREGHRGHRCSSFLQRFLTTPHEGN